MTINITSRGLWIDFEYPTLVELISRAGPEISNLLRLDVAWGERRTLQRGSWDLQDRQRGRVGSQSLSHARNGGDERRQGKALAEGDKRRKRSNVLHRENN